VDRKLRLSQPADGGWHFYVTDKDPNRAATIATHWAYEFANAVQLQNLTPDGLNPLIAVAVTQTAQAPAGRSSPLSTYLSIGALSFLAVSAFLALFFTKSK
jgi:hypothetical protein